MGEELARGGWLKRVRGGRECRLVIGWSVGGGFSFRRLVRRARPTSHGCRVNPRADGANPKKKKKPIPRTSRA